MIRSKVTAIRTRVWIWTRTWIRVRVQVRRSIHGIGGGSCSGCERCLRWAVGVTEGTKRGFPHLVQYRYFLGHGRINFVCAHFILRRRRRGQEVGGGQRVGRVVRRETRGVSAWRSTTESGSDPLNAVKDTLLHRRVRRGARGRKRSARMRRRRGVDRRHRGRGGDERRAVRTATTDVIVPSRSDNRGDRGSRRKSACKRKRKWI